MSSVFHESWGHTLKILLDDFLKRVMHWIVGSLVKGIGQPPWHLCAAETLIHLVQRVFLSNFWHSIISSFLFPSSFHYYEQQPKFRSNPCTDKLMKLINALEASEGKINGPVYKYVKDVEECYKVAGIEEKKSGQAGTSYYLSQYLDLNKFKQK